MRFVRPAALVLAAATLAFAAGAAVRAETNEVRISKGFGLTYLPLYVMQHGKLLEKHAAAAGLGDIKVSWPTIDGGNLINDAMLAGTLDIAGIGVSGFLTIWAKTKGQPRYEVGALSALGATSLYLNTRNPNIRTLRDFTEKDRIAVPGVKTSLAAFFLQMAVAQEFGIENYAKLDPLTVGVPYPEATAAMINGGTEINSHFASPPFSLIELKNPAVHRVVNSVDVFGHLTVLVNYSLKSFHDANPKTCAAFIGALHEADELIARDRRGAARIYNELAKVKTTEEETMVVLDDPDSVYTPTPVGVMKYADFMARTGQIKLKPEKWQDVFFPEAHHLPGS
jgi:NitT/TauT family transport system substrate-binding protein